MSRTGAAERSRNDALDGLRFVAVAAVVAFHYGVPGAGAGFLGVDVFFVLSGYLITSLLLSQVVEGRVRLAEFWTRRARRLVPALIPVLVALVVWGATVAPSYSRDRLRGDIASTLFYVANWHFISTSTYFAGDGVASPLEHMWSLGVEEQFYLAWPLVLGLVAVVLRGRKQLAAIGLIATIGLSVSAWRLSDLWTSGHDRAYLGTDSRIFEPLAGAVLAVLMTSPRVRAGLARMHLPLVLLGTAGLAWGAARLGGAGGATAAYARGGALVVTMSTAAIIAAVSVSTGVATGVLAWAPGAYLGRLSYGIYLWHWPLWVWTQPRAWLDLTALGWAAHALVLTAVTIVLAAVSYRFVESTIRYGRVARFLVPRRTLALLAAALTALFLANQTVVVPYAGATLGRTTKTILLVGDSVPQRLAPYLSAAAASHGYVVISATRGSCPASGVELVNARGRPWGPGTQCATDVPARQDSAVADYRPALVIWWSRYELADRIDASGRPVPFGGAAYWTLQRRAFGLRTAALTSKGAIVVAVQIERTGIGIAGRCRPSACGPFLARLVHGTSAQRTWNSFLASHRTGRIRSISIDRLVCHGAGSPCNDRLPSGRPARPDGTHYGQAAAADIARAVIKRSLIVAGLERRH